MSDWEISVFENHQCLFNTTFTGPFEMGRQDRGEPAPYVVKSSAGLARLIMASVEEDRVPRKFIRLDPQPSGVVTITNLSPRVPLRIEQGPVIKPGSQLTLPPPITLLVEQRAIRVQPIVNEASELKALAQVTIAPFQHISLKKDLVSAQNKGELGIEAMVPWLQAAMGVLQSAAGDSEFFERAARAVVDLVGLDSCRVLLRERGTWRLQVTQTAAGISDEVEVPVSRKILDRILQEKRTFWELPVSNYTGSLLGIKALVAAPILDRQAQIIGVLYGDRFSKANRLKPITELEAMLVELLANGVATGLARVEQEQAALRTRVQFEQFFTPLLSKQLLSKPELLEGRDEEVTVLFCDIRGFSRISDRLGARRTIDWTCDVLGALSECVLREFGVLVDYVGDELMAMWGAPEKQTDHASRACRTALEMIAQLPALNERWRAELAEPIQLGIGINTGSACVGNVGSHCKFKYGPRGTTVNLASRVQGANRFWKTDLLMTQHTHERIGAAFATRRLGPVRVLNLDVPVTLFELSPPGQAKWPLLKQGYELALSQFENRNFAEALARLGEHLTRFPHDGPASVLATRIEEYQRKNSPAFDAVWKLPGK